MIMNEFWDFCASRRKDLDGVLMDLDGVLMDRGNCAYEVIREFRTLPKRMTCSDP